MGLHLSGLWLLVVTFGKFLILFELWFLHLERRLVTPL